MLSDALSDGADGLDYYLIGSEWREHYDAKTLARADVIRAAMEAVRGMLDTRPAACDAIEAAIAGDEQALEAQITAMTEEWRQASPPNLHFSPTDFRRWAQAAVLLLRAVDAHLVPLLPDMRPLLPHKDDD